MNDKKICFITCVNDDRQYEECLLYINNLNIPEGYEIDAVSIKEAESMTAGYNAAMQNTDAKYKVYLHQDTFIINKNFLYDMLNVFNSDENIGMIGVAGAKTIPTNGVWQDSVHKYGQVYESHTGKMELLAFNEVKNNYEEVKAIDGLIMITQYDIPWREDTFDGWHFYDVSQSVEFILAGYKVVVPKQNETWCVHDCEIVNMQNEYNNYKNRFLDEYTKTIIQAFINDIKKENNILDEEAIEWRNYYVKKTKNEEFVTVIDKYLIGKFDIESERASELFDFDKIEALEIINNNKQEFFKYIYNAKVNLYNRNYERACRWCFQGAKYACENHTGFYTSLEIERILIECAKNVTMSQYRLSIPKINGKKRKVLHVLSEGYSIGGHTRLVKNWIENDKNSIHSVITTWQINSIPGWLVNAVVESGGWTYSLQHFNNFMDRASVLREVAYQWADVIVIHIHMFDPIPIIAFGVAGGPVVLFMNHADHIFWIGTSIVDNLINFRQSGKELSNIRRGVTKNFILPLPLKLPNIKSEDKNIIRKTMDINENTVILLTIATPYKFKTFGKIHYIDILKKVLERNSNAVAIVIGPDNVGIWQDANKETNGKIIPIGIQENIEKYYEIADIYVDSYMFASITSALGAGLYKLPIVALQNYNNRTLSFDDISYENNNKEFDNVEDLINYISKLIENKNYREENAKELRAQIEEDHIYKWCDYLNEIYKKIENKVHNVYLNNEFENKLSNEDLCLALFQKSQTNNGNNKSLERSPIIGWNSDMKDTSMEKMRDKRVKVVFFTQYPPSWSCTESVWKAFKQDENFEVQIVQLPFYHPDYDKVNNEEIGGSYLNDRQIPFKYWYKYNIEKENPDLVFFQSPYDHNRPVEFSVSSINKLGCKIAYIPYAFEIIKNLPGTTKEYIQVISELPIMQKCWKVFLRSKNSKRMYLKHSSREEDYMVVTGHPKIDYVVNYRKPKLDIIKSCKKYTMIGNKKVILWNPNISDFDGNNKWNLYIDLLELIKKNRDIIFIMRPHPLQLIKLKDNNISDNYLFEKFKNTLRELDNIILDDSPDYREAFLLSDALMTCSSSLIFEYLATQKPILHMPKAYEVELNEDGEILKYLYKGDRIEEIDLFFKYTLECKDPLKNERMKIISDFLHAIDGKNGERIKNYIVDHLKMS